MKEVMLMYAISMLGTPYRWAGDNPLEGLDCSGYLGECLRSVGLAPREDRTAQGYYYYLSKELEAPLSISPMRGDILFFGPNENHITHTAIAIDPYHMIESGGGNETTTTREAAAKKGAMVRIRPINNRTDLFVALRIFK